MGHRRKLTFERSREQELGKNSSVETTRPSKDGRTSELRPESRGSELNRDGGPRQIGIAKPGLGRIGTSGAGLVRRTETLGWDRDYGSTRDFKQAAILVETEGQIERQRRNLLFILLKQVPENKHFKMMNTRAKQIAFDIVRRGYSVQASFPGSSPPWECANIWGPALLETVMSTSDTATIQQSALDLLQLMLIGDVSVLSALFIRNKASSKGQTPPNLAQEDEDEDGEEVGGLAGTGLGERPNVLSVNEFRRLQRSAVDEADRWRCVPIIWDFLRKVSPSAVPCGLAETVFWAASQFSPLEGGPPGEMERETICANGDLAERISVELRQAMSWANSTGVDDCNEVSCVNAVLAKHYWMQLIWILKRWAGMFVQRYRSIKVVNQPWVVEGLVLLFLDADTEMGAFRKEMMKAYAGGKEDKVALDDFFAKICSSPATSALIARGFQHAAHMLLAQEFQYSVRRLAQFAFYVKKILESIISRKPTEASAWDHVVARICEISWQAIVEPLTTVSPCGMGKHNLDVQYAQLSFVNIFQLLQVLWQYLPRTGRNAPVTRTILPKDHQYPHQDYRSIGTDVISKIIRWGLTRDLSVRRRWKGAIEVIMKDLLQHLDQLPPEILDAGKQVLEAGTSPLTDEERIALAPLFKNAAPGSLGRGLLENLPRVSGERVSASGSKPGGKVAISIGQKNGSVLNLNSVKSEPVSPEDSSSGKAALHVDSSCEMNADQFSFKDALQSGSRVRGREVAENGDATDIKIADDQFNFKDALQSRRRLRGRGVAEDGDDTDKILADCLRSTSLLRARVEGLDKDDELTASAAVRVKEEPMGRESCPFTINDEGTRWSKPEWVEMEHGIVMIPDDDEDESKGQSAESDLETKTSEDSRASRQYLSGLKRPCSDADYANEHIGRSELSRPSTPRVSNASKGASRGGVASVRGDKNPGAPPEGASGNRLFGVPLDGAMGSQAGPAKRRKVETGKGISKFAAMRKDYHAERQKMHTTIAANKCRMGNASVAAVHSNQGFARDQAVLDGEPRERYRPVLEETSHYGNKGTDGELDALRNILKLAGQGSRRKTIQLGTPGKVAGRGSSGTSTGRIGKSGQRPPPPRLDDWWKEILKLDYHEVVRAESDRDKDALRKAGLLRVQNRFVDSSDYQKNFAPLVLEEFKAQIQKEHMEGNGNASGRGAEPKGVLRLMSLEKVDDFWVGRFMGEPGSDAVLRSCFEHDLLLLVRQAGAGSGPPPHMLAKVEKRDRDSKMRGVILHLRFYLPASNERLVKARSSLRDNSKWETTKLLSLISNIREFQALSSIENLPFLDVILRPCPEHGQTVARELCLGALPQPLRERLEREYNESQLSAIAASIGPKPGATEQGHHLALIQGPPGTGKTRTILAIVSALLALWAHNLEARRNTSQNGCVGRGSDEGEPIKLGHWRRSGRGRVLVCAQSNAAVDELVARIFKCNRIAAREGRAAAAGQQLPLPHPSEMDNPTVDNAASGSPREACSSNPPAPQAQQEGSTATSVGTLDAAPVRQQGETMTASLVRLGTHMQQVQEEQQREAAAEAARLNAIARAEEQRRRQLADATANHNKARRDAASVLVQQEAAHTATLQAWHVDPAETMEPTVEDQTKLALANMMHQVILTCNWQQVKLARQARTITEYEETLKSLHARLDVLEKDDVPHRHTASSSINPSICELEERMDHLVALVGDLNTLYLCSTGASQMCLNHLAQTEGVEVSKLYTKITWDAMTEKWQKRFIVDDAQGKGVNRIFNMHRGSQPTREWLTEWQKIVTIPNLDIPFVHLRREFFQRSVDAVSTALGERSLYTDLTRSWRRRAKSSKPIGGQPTSGEVNRLLWKRAKARGRSKSLLSKEMDKRTTRRLTSLVKETGSTPFRHDATTTTRRRRQRRCPSTAKLGKLSFTGSEATPFPTLSDTVALLTTSSTSGEHAYVASLHEDYEDYAVQLVPPLDQPLHVQESYACATSSLSPSEPAPSPTTLGDSSVCDLDPLTPEDFQWLPLPPSGSLPKPHCNALMAELRNYLHAAVLSPLMEDGVAVVDLREYIAKIDREYATQRYDDTDAPLLYIRIQIGKATCSALIDWGATRNYISQDFMTRAGLGPRVRRESQPTQVTLADGRMHKSIDRCIDSVPVYFRPLAREAVSFDILDTKFDMILGMSWLCSEDHPVNFYRRTVHVRDRNGVLVPCMVPPPHPSIGCHVVSAASIRNSIARNDVEEMGICFLHALPPPDEPAAEQPPDPRIVQLLDSYGDVFEAPAGIVKFALR
ncbi:hypothetical protein CBR_g45904 [Chara braunii]|uniref:Uncharacterized protein n=1 Tax=Chara braunii TaxID=69332 RepID=A0A388LZJ7_CHABU|nr:hypothetical protein CBR_g45904 [Chara braunii]|eukprot:GBG87750.1 hypothetical protein CBR_g45904 [Chara braunii]